LERLVEKHAHGSEVGVMEREEVVEMLREIGVFREMEAGGSALLRRSTSPMQPGPPRQMQHRRQDSYKKT
jgi:hypothetical protein